jgi:hypothetical protein
MVSSRVNGFAVFRSLTRAAAAAGAEADLDPLDLLPSGRILKSFKFSSSPDAPGNLRERAPVILSFSD